MLKADITEIARTVLLGDEKVRFNCTVVAPTGIMLGERRVAMLVSETELVNFLVIVLAGPVKTIETGVPVVVAGRAIWRTLLEQQETTLRGYGVTIPVEELIELSEIVKAVLVRSAG